MKVTLYMAISIDGCITRGDNDSDWVSESDWEQFFGYIQANDAVIMGRKTMEQFDEDEFPIPGTVNIVLSENPKLHRQDSQLVITNSSPQDVVKLAEQKGLNNLMLIGGTNVNVQFLKAHLINEIVLSVHPLIIGNGLKLFGNEEFDVKLELLGTRALPGNLVQLRYKVL